MLTRALAQPPQYKALDSELFLKLLGNNQSFTAITFLEELETEANNIISLIHTALRSAYPKKKARSFGTPWWNDECRRAAHDYHRACRVGPASFEKFELQRVVRQTKKNYWKSHIEDSKSLTDVYKFVRWHNTAPRYQSPPLRSDSLSDPVFDPYAKARLLLETLLCRYLDAEDIPLDTPTAPCRSIH
ncbi:hypothetical protein K3495_g2706 [Podosphaera aphanis]|nr:hypothetical protein K3495_g2706 [Podosphaera aphanis]